MAAISGRYTITEILSREQFRIKLSPGYYVFSIHNIVVFAICFLLIESFVFSMSLYLLLSMFVYIYLFSLNKDGNYYDVFLLKYLVKLSFIVRNKTRIREKMLSKKRWGKKWKNIFLVLF